MLYKAAVLETSARTDYAQFADLKTWVMLTCPTVFENVPWAELESGKFLKSSVFLESGHELLIERSEVPTQKKAESK